jgi:hypothetical protein
MAGWNVQATSLGKQKRKNKAGMESIGHTWARKGKERKEKHRRGRPVQINGPLSGGEG